MIFINKYYFVEYKNGDSDIGSFLVDTKAWNSSGDAWEEAVRHIESFHVNAVITKFNRVK